MFGQRKTQSMPASTDAPPGRTDALVVAEKHYVLGTPMQPASATALAYGLFGMGCFWGAERRYWELDGVYVTAAGYAGGYTPNATYHEVCSVMSGHNEVVRVVFDPARVTYSRLLEVFWRQIDPTDPDGQFVDRGAQYGTAIFYHSEAQRLLAEGSKTDLNTSGRFSRPSGA